MFLQEWNLMKNSYHLLFKSLDQFVINICHSNSSKDDRENVMVKDIKHIENSVFRVNCM